MENEYNSWIRKQRMNSTIEPYETESGKKPAEDFIASLDAEHNKMSWLDDRIAEDMKNPKFKAARDKYEPEYKVIQYMIDNNITFTQDFLNVLDELTEKGVVFDLVPVESIRKDKEALSVPEYV